MDEMTSGDKRELLSQCRRDLQSREAGYLAELGSLDAAAAAETKSSAGDKYETGREMIAQSRHLIQRNLAEILAHLEALQRMAATDGEGGLLAGDRIGFGSLVETSLGWCLVGISLGDVEFHGHSIRTVSLASPLGLALKGGRVGDRMPWRGGGIDIVRLVA